MAKKLSSTEIDAELDAARARTKMARASGRRAVTATYDAKHQRLMLLLTSGIIIGIPVAQIKSLAKVPAAQLKRVSVTPTGSGISWNDLDIDLTLEGLLTHAFGRSTFARSLGRLGGAATTEAKVSAARDNGKKGGRPRKHAA